MIEGLYLSLTNDGFISYDSDITAYIRFTGNDQWLACQNRPYIIQALAKLSKHNVKPIDQY